MRDGTDTIPTGALETVAYLARSPNRIRILDALADGSYSRRELAGATGAARTTLDRIVNELDERGWVRRTADGTYAATPTGRQLMAQVRPFLGAVEAIHRLDDAVAWLPADELTIGLQHFSDATVRRPDQDDPMATVDYFTNVIGGTADCRVLTHLAPPGPLARAMRDRIEAGRLAAEYVLTDELVDYLRSHPERRARWRTMIDDGAAVFRTEGPLPCNLWIFDGHVFIKQSGPDPIRDSYGTPIHSENETVRGWAHDLLDRWRAEATRVDGETFAGAPAEPHTDRNEG